MPFRHFTSSFATSTRTNRTLPVSAGSGSSFGQKLTGWLITVSFAASVLFCSVADIAFAQNRKPAAAKTDAPAEESEEGFVSIFNGKDLTGWEGDTQYWSVHDAAITGVNTAENPTKENTFIIWRDGTVDDFVLRLDFMISGNNSGIQYRSKEFPGGFKIGGYQADFEIGETYTGICYEERGRGILSLRGEKTEITETGEKKVLEKLADTVELQKKINKDDWNKYEIIAEGNHLIHKINDVVMTEVIDNQVDKRAMSGLLALQLHAGPPMNVKFKNIRIKRLKLQAGLKKVVLVAGTPSHAAGDHEFNAGIQLFQKWLSSQPGIQPVYYLNGWPNDPSAFDAADCVVLYMNGGDGHPVIQGDRLRQFHKLMSSGVGLCCLHYAVEVPADRGGAEFLEWIGGYYETHFSINPTWKASFAALPTHPVTRGVQPFDIDDEWYFNIRFPSDASNITPLLQATPPDAVRGTPAAAAHPGRIETVAWAIERPNGGRGFGFTGGHFHRNWADPNFRKLVLNAVLWTAGAEVPSTGCESTVTPEEMGQNLDKK